MTSFDIAVDFVLLFEGGLSDDPSDSGGVTRFGISQKAYPDLDIRNMTMPQAKEIYRADYWNRCKCNELPVQLALILFDAAVNQGPAAAIRMLQKSLDVRADGVIGAETIAAAHRADVRKVASEFIARRAYQYAIHPQVARFGLGWYRRLAACHRLTQDEPAYHA